MLSRTGDDYLRAQVRQARRRAALAVAVGAAVIVMAAAGLTRLDVATPAAPRALATPAAIGGGLLAALVGAAGASRATRRAVRYRAGAAGEDALARVLGEGLGDDYTLYRNLRPGVGGDLDAVLLGPAGLVVLEVKAYRGAFVLFGDRWYRAASPDGGDLTPWRGSPTLQARRNADRLALWLALRGLAATPLYPLVVLTSGHVREVRTRPRVPVVPLQQLVPYLHALPRARLPVEQWQALHAALDRLNAADR